jgi:hypothetical protein
LLEEDRRRITAMTAALHDWNINHQTVRQIATVLGGPDPDLKRDDRLSVGPGGSGRRGTRSARPSGAPPHPNTLGRSRARRRPAGGALPEIRPDEQSNCLRAQNRSARLYAAPNRPRRSAIAAGRYVWPGRLWSDFWDGCGRTSARTAKGDSIRSRTRVRLLGWTADGRFLGAP